MDFLTDLLFASWKMVEQASVYMLFGMLVGGMLKTFLSPSYVAAHLGRGRITSVVKAALLGIPIPLCSCSVLPAAAFLKKQGANKGATAAFLISTPESGIDSISITWALLDPIMTAARPVSAFISAFVAGCAENFLGQRFEGPHRDLDNVPANENCCGGQGCSCEGHGELGLYEKLIMGLKYAVTELWGDIAPWFFAGVLLAGIIQVVVPEEFITGHLGGGLRSMLFMLALGIPMYICATASTPIAAALIMKGVSPGTALVFLLAGPATNITSLTVITGLLGRRAVVLYLGSIAVVSVLCGLVLDEIYFSLGIPAMVSVGAAAELLPVWLIKWGAVILLLFSIGPLFYRLKSLVNRKKCSCSSVFCKDSEEN